MSDYRYNSEPKPPILVAQSEGEILYPFNSTLIRRARSVAAWPVVLVAISTINIFLCFYRAPIRSPFGFYTTELIFELGHRIGPVFTGLALIVDLGILGALAVCGYYTFRYYSWAYLTTIVFISFDTLVMVLLTFIAGLWGILVFGSVCRVLVIYSLYLGSKAAKLYRARILNGQA